MPEHREAVISLLVRAPLPATPTVSPRPAGEYSREVNPSSERAVAAGLLAYLKPRLAPALLEYAEPPVQIPNGWETYTYRLHLRDTPWLAPAFRRPLILHIYASPRGVARGRHEFAVQRHLHQLGYPVPKPLLLEESCELFGGPFLLFEQAPGRTLFETLLYQPWRFCRGPAKMAAAHFRLHVLPTDSFPAPAGPFLPRRLEELRQLIREYGLNGLQPGWTWLAEHGPEAPRSPSILHLDYHPVNIVGRGIRSMSVIDWTEADVGDPHADVATTLMLIECVPVGKPQLLTRLVHPVGRFLLARRYLKAYRKLAALDERKLAYYRGLAALRRLCGYGRWLRASPLATGSKPSSLCHLSADHLQTLQGYFQKWTAVAVSL